MVNFQLTLTLSVPKLEHSGKTISIPRPDVNGYVIAYV